MAEALSDALFLRVDPDSREKLAESSDLEARLGALVERGRIAWPGIELDAAAFVAYIGDRLDPGSGLGELEALRTDDLYLAAACALGVRGSIERFEQTYAPQIAKAIGHMDRTRTLVDDVSQAMWTKLFASEPGRVGKIADFTGRSKLWRWLRVIATRTAIDLSAPDRFSGRLADSQLPDETGDLELAHWRETYTREFRDAFAEAVEALDPDERTLLKMHLIDRLTIDQLGALESVHRATAARRLQRARDRLASLTLERMQSRLGVDGDGVQSIMRLIRSRLDASVTRLLNNEH